jgi:hypothetical protein
LDAFDNIITQCIEDSGFWGGYWSLDGEVYNITNVDYPNNPLLPDDEGGPGNLAPNSGLCDLPKNDGATYVDSGAAQYLQDFLAANGDSELNPMFSHQESRTIGVCNPRLTTCAASTQTNG